MGITWRFPINDQDLAKHEAHLLTEEGVSVLLCYNTSLHVNLVETLTKGDKFSGRSRSLVPAALSSTSGRPREFLNKYFRRNTPKLYGVVGGFIIGCAVDF